MYNQHFDWNNANLRPVDQARTQLCPFPGVTPDGKCHADKCAAWEFRDDGRQFATTTNIVRHTDGTEGVTGEPPAPPSGEGWEKDGEPTFRSYTNRAKLNLPHGLEQNWVRFVSVTRGCCGRIFRGGDGMPW